MACTFPDLNLDFYLLGHLKQMVFASVINNSERLHRRSIRTCESVRHLVAVFEIIRKSVIERVHSCVEAP